MFTSRKFFKDATKSIVLEEAKKSLSDTAILVGELIDKNNKSDLNLNFKKRNNNQLREIQNKSIINYMDAQGNMLPAYMNPNQNMYMEQAILPSSDYWESIKQEMDGSSKKTTKPYSDLSWGKPFSLKTFSENVPCSGHYKLVKIKSYAFIVNTPIPGLNQHIKNPNIFFSVSPNVGYETKIPKEQRDEIEYRKQLNQYGQYYLTDIINQVKKSVHPKTQISCIVLGNRALQENMEAYDPWFLVEEEQNIEHYYMLKEESKAKVDVNVYNIDAHGHSLNLTSTDLKTLHELAANVQKKDGAGEALIVHCQQGLDRTGMLIFAFILFENYDYFFMGEYRADKIYAAYTTLLESRSPTALTKIPDLVNAIYLAHALKAIDLEKYCLTNFACLASENKKNSNNAFLLMTQLNDVKSDADKLKILESELKRLEEIRNTQSETSDSDKLKALEIELRKVEEVQDNEESIMQINPKRRPNSINYNQPSEGSIEEIKKSNSYPCDLHTYREKPGKFKIKSKDNNELTKPQKTSSGLFVKKRAKHLSDNLKQHNNPIQNGKKIEQESKGSHWITGETNKLKLSSISESKIYSSSHGALPTYNEKPENTEIKPENNVEIKTVSTSTSGIFAKKSKKRQSVHLKELEATQNPANTYLNEIAYFKNVIQHKKDTEEVLQNRIKPGL